MSIPPWTSTRFSRTSALMAALLFLVLGVVFALVNENGYRRQKLGDLAIQSAIAAESVTAALMFSDAAAAQDYASALARNPQIAEVGVYDVKGARIASFARDGFTTPTVAPEPHAPRFDHSFASAVTPVVRDGGAYGAFYIRLQREPFTLRLLRYGPLALLFIMAALVILVAGAAHDALTRANTNLRAQADALTETNTQLAQEVQQRKEAEESLLQSRKMEAIGQLTGGVAHDFNNLLMIISGGLRMLDRQTDERRRKTMEAIHQAVDRGAGLTRQLLAFSRRQPLRPETIDTRRQLEGMREMLERSIRADIILDIVAPDGLPPIKTDPGQFELAVVNLAVNARDAMPNGGMLTVTARRATDTRVEVVVADTGTGIPPDILHRIFEPYFTTKQVGKGTGLGMAQVYGFATQGGGDARIESEVGVGTRVILSLPVSDEPLPTTGAVAAETDEAAALKRNVLVVEDEDSVADMVCAMLLDMGHSVERAKTANEALTLIASNPSYDLVFSDIVMPGGKNGIELALELETVAPDLPVLLTTGYSGREDADPRRPVLHKPYQAPALQSAIAALPLRGKSAVAS